MRGCRDNIPTKWTLLGDRSGYYPDGMDVAGELPGYYPDEMDVADMNMKK